MKSCFLILLLSTASLFAKTEIIFWHAFEGFLYDQFAEIVDDFNHQSKGYEVKLIYKGNYTETFNLGIEAIEKGEPPHILQVYEVATQTMMLKEGAYRSVDYLMRHYFKKFDSDVLYQCSSRFFIHLLITKCTHCLGMHRPAFFSIIKMPSKRRG